MKRILDFEVAGKVYPHNFSVKVARKVDEDFGGLENLGDVMDGGVGKGLFTVCALLHEMMEQGAAYKRLTEGEEIEIPSMDDLETLIGMQDASEMVTVIMQAAGFGSKATVEVEPDEKNEKTAQSD